MSKKASIFAVYFASFLSFYYFFPIIILAVLYTWFSDISQDVVILVVTLPTLLMAFINLGLSAILGRANKKLMLILGLAMIFVSGAMVVFTAGHSFYVVLIAAVLSAAGYAFIYNTSNVVLMELDPANANKAIGVNAAVGCAGLTILSYVVGLLARDGYFPRVYYLNFLTILPILALIFLYHPEKKSASDAAQAATAAAVPKAKITSQGITRFIALIIPAMLITIAAASWNNNTSPYIMLDKQIGTSVQTGMMSTMASIGGMVSGFLVVGPMTKALKQWTVPVGLLIIIACFSTIAFGTTSMIVLYIASFMFMIGMQPVTTKNLTTASKALPASVALPMYNALAGFVGFAAPYVVNFLGDLLGGSISARVTGGIILAAIALVIMIPVHAHAEKNWSVDGN